MLLAQKEHTFGPYVRTWVKHLEGLHNYSSVSLIFCFLSVCAVCINDKWTSACIMCSKWYSVRIAFRFPFQVSINVSVVRIVQYPFTYCHPFMGKLLYVSSGVLISLNTISLKVCVEPSPYVFWAYAYAPCLYLLCQSFNRVYHLGQLAYILIVLTWNLPLLTGPSLIFIFHKYYFHVFGLEA